MLPIGTKVRLRFTGETGVVTGYMDDDVLQVRLDNDPDFTIPTFEEDVAKLDVMIAPPPLIGGKRKDLPPPPPAKRTLKLAVHAASNKGLVLCFEPMPGLDGSVLRYKMWLFNDTTYEFVFKLDVYTEVRDIVVLDDLIDAATLKELGDFMADDLNDGTEVWVSVQRLTTAGLDDSIENKMKIRPKQFFGHLHETPLIGQLTHQFVLLSDFKNKETKQDSLEDLKAFARQQVRKPKPAPTNSSPIRSNNVEEFAAFIPEIDLHIQSIMPGYARIDKGEILRVQMNHFHKFMDRAIRLGAPRVYIIHGVGEGKLKEAVATSLRENAFVHKFKNEYHIKYGYGATEVVF